MGDTGSQGIEGTMGSNDATFQKVGDIWVETTVKEPMNVSNLTISSYNRSYLIDKFPMQKIGTTKNFKTSKSRGYVEYTKEGIFIVEYTSRKAPKSSAIKKTPYRWKLDYFKGVGVPNGTHIDTYREVYKPEAGYLYLDPYLRVADLFFVDDNTIRVIFFIPNETYLRAKANLNKDTLKIKVLAESDLRYTKMTEAHYGISY